MHMEGGSQNRLRELREQRRVRVIDVAAAAGKDQSVIRRYESGDVPIPLDVITKLALYHGVSRSYLMGWDEDHLEPAA